MRAILLSLVPVLLGGCILHTPDRDVDPSRELEIVDDATLASLSSNADDAPLSFRHAVETLAGERAPAAFMASWLQALGPEVEENVGAFTLDRAPFRLIAVANRMDLAGKPGLGALGEGRLVFALTDGPADDAASKPRPMTVIVEYALPSTRTKKEWAIAFHSLAAHPLGSVDYRDALAAVVTSFATRDALSQVRWNDPATGLRELHLASRGDLVASPLRNTPPRWLDGSSALDEYASAHQADIDNDDYELPSFLLAMSALPDARPWTLAKTSDTTRQAFALGTCGGCHADHALDGGFHVSPLRSGEEKLSPMLRADFDRRITLLDDALESQ